MRLPRLAAALLLGLLLAGCDGAASRDTTGPRIPPGATSSASGGATAPATGAPSTPLPTSPGRVAGTLVSFGRQGGIAGTDDRISVRGDGSYEISRRRGPVISGRLPADEFIALRRVLESSGFAKIPAVNPGGNVADGYAYRVVYAGHEVLAEDGGIPAALDPVIGALHTLLSRYAPA